MTDTDLPLKADALWAIYHKTKKINECLRCDKIRDCKLRLDGREEDCERIRMQEREP